MGATPVPLSATVCGLPGRGSETVIAPLRTPVAVGEKVTLMLQLAAGARVAGLTGQLFVCAKSPLAETPMVVAVLPLLLTLTVRALLVVPTSWLPKLRLEGETVTGGGVWFRRILTNSSLASTKRASGAPSPLKSPTAVTCEKPLTR